jgi:hypothetical protein
VTVIQEESDATGVHAHSEPADILKLPVPPVASTVPPLGAIA